MKKSILVFVFLLLLTSAKSAEVMTISIDGGIGAATVEYIESSIEEAEEAGVDALVIKLNTPGGLLESTRDIVKDMLSSEVPIFVYVAPGGSRAGSAGVFITLAAHVAAMAPGTNIGAAHPVGMGGKMDSASVMSEKATNDAAAFVRTIAEKRGKNIEWAEKTVRFSIASTETEALQEGAIDFITSSLDSLLIMADGMEIFLNGQKHTISTANSDIIDREMSFREKFLAFISDPNIAYIFMMLAIYGILMELYNPGAIFPGVIGVLSGLIAGYSLQLLPVNYAGLGLILLAIVLFVIEIYVASYGLLSLGGVVSLFAGSVMLIDTPLEFMDISLSLIITVSILTLLFFVLLVWLGLKVQFNKHSSGTTGQIGERGEAITDIKSGQYGKVKTHGEIWKATSDFDIKIGDKVEIVEFDSLEIKVKPYIKN